MKSMAGPGYLHCTQGQLIFTVHPSDKDDILSSECEFDLKPAKCRTLGPPTVWFEQKTYIELQLKFDEDILLASETQQVNG